MIILGDYYKEFQDMLEDLNINMYIMQWKKKN